MNVDKKGLDINIQRDGVEKYVPFAVIDDRKMYVHYKYDYLTNESDRFITYNKKEAINRLDKAIIGERKYRQEQMNEKIIDKKTEYL